MSDKGIHLHSLDPTALDPPVWAIRRGVLLAVLALVGMVAGAAAVAGFARSRQSATPRGLGHTPSGVAASESARPRQSRPAYPVLDVRLTTTIASVTPRYAGRSTGESWTSPALGRVREAPVSSPGAPDYYVRDRAGAWSYIVYAPSGSAGRWRHIAPPGGRAPPLLTERQVTALFTRLRAEAGARGVLRVGLDHRLADTFTTRQLTWPFRYDGLTRVWSDDVTARPRQIRITTRQGATTTTILITIDRMRTISSASLPDDFFTPPG